MMNEFLNILLDVGLTPKQLEVAKSCLANYAFMACMDSSVRQEAENICQVELNNVFTNTNKFCELRCNI